MNRPCVTAQSQADLFSRCDVLSLHLRHIGYVSRDEYEVQFTDVFEQIVAYAAGKPINVVNPDVLDKRR